MNSGGKKKYIYIERMKGPNTEIITRYNFSLLDHVESKNCYLRQMQYSFR